MLSKESLCILPHCLVMVVRTDWSSVQPAAEFNCQPCCCPTLGSTTPSWWHGLAGVLYNHLHHSTVTQHFDHSDLSWIQGLANTVKTGGPHALKRPGTIPCRAWAVKLKNSGAHPINALSVNEGKEGGWVGICLHYVSFNKLWSMS